MPPFLPTSPQCHPNTSLQIPSLYDGDLTNEEEVLAWLIQQLHTDEIEDITDEMLDKLIKESNHLAVLFCEYGGENLDVE